MFRCVVGYAGVYDLTLFDGEANRSWSRALRAINHRFVQATVGSDDAVLKRFSPVYNAGKIKAPILLIHGRRDETAPIEHARRLRKAVEETGSPPEWLEEGDEGHGFCDEGARADVHAPSRVPARAYVPKELKHLLHGGLDRGLQQRDSAVGSFRARRRSTR